MAEAETSQVDTNQPAPESTTPEPKPSGAVDSDEGEGKPKVFDEAYVKDLRKEAAKHRTEARELQERLAKIEAEKESAEEKKLADQNEWKALAEKREQELAKLKTELETERLNGLKSRIGGEFKLTPRLIERLQGKTEDEIRADAEAIAKELGLDKPQAETQSTDPKTNPARGQKTAIAPDGQAVGTTDAERRARRGIQESPIFNTDNAGGQPRIISKGGLNKRTYP